VGRAPPPEASKAILPPSGGPPPRKNGEGSHEPVEMSIELFGERD